MTAVRAVILDFGNVICFPPSPEKIARAAADCGLTVEQFVHAFWVPRLEYDAGLLEPAAFWNAVASAAGTRFAAALLPTLICHEVEFWNCFDARVLAWIDALRALNIRTAILSNLPRVLGEALRATPGFLERFDHVTFSYELRMVKPSPGIYHDAVDGLHVAPAEALFLDDKQANVDGAHAVGLRAEIFTTWEDFLGHDVAGRYALPRPT
jgi:putative hydrolase of the HAD superfamily